MGLQPTASNTGLLEQCPRPFDPEIEIPEEYETAATKRRDAAARYGDAFHALEEQHVRKLRKVLGLKLEERILDRYGVPQPEREDLILHARKAFAELLGWLTKNNPFGIDFLRGGPSLETEQSYALQPGGCLSSSEPPDAEDHVYPDLERGEIGMTIDLELWSPKPDDWVLFVDYKSGRLGDWSSPALVPQMRTIGLAGVSPPGDRDVGHVQPTKVYLAVLDANRAGIPAVYGDEYEPEEQAKHERRLRKALRLIGSGYIRPGPLCPRCPVRGTCPAQDVDLLGSSAALIHAATDGLAKVAKNDRLSLGERLGKFHQLRNEINRLFARVDPDIRRGVEEILRTGGFVVRPDGQLLEFEERQVERLSKKSFVDVLGKVEAEKWFKRLRKLGVLEAKTEVQLRAVPNERVLR